VRAQAVGSKEAPAQALSLQPNTNNVTLLLWSQRMVIEGICPTITPKILAFLQHKDKLNKFKIELITGVCRETTQGWGHGFGGTNL
jgi:hypothetical protein